MAMTEIEARGTTVLNAVHKPELEPPYGKLTALEDEAGMTAELYEARLYPDIAFEFNTGWIEGFGSIAPSQESRSRAVFSALKNGWDEYDGPDHLGAEQLFRKFTKHYLTGKIKLDHQTQVSRGDLLNLDVQLDAQMDEYFRSHHPVAQLMSQLALEYPELPKGIVRDIQRRVVLAVDHDHIKETYAAAIKAAKIGHTAVSTETKA